MTGPDGEERFAFGVDALLSGFEAMSRRRLAVKYARAVTEWFDELAEFLRIPSISADPAHAADVRRAGEWVRDLIRGAGGEASSSTGTASRWRSARCAPARDADAAPDGALLRPLRRAARRPARAVGVRAVRARDPGRDAVRTRRRRRQGAALPAAGRAPASSPPPGALPVNVRFACDGEEETGGHSIVEFLEADERGADAAIIFDSGMIARGPARLQHRHPRARLLPRRAPHRRA